MQYEARQSSTFALKLRYEADDETVHPEVTTSATPTTAATEKFAQPLQRTGTAWLPQTGDTLPLSTLASLLAASGCVLVVLLHKYRSDHNARKHQTE